MNEFETKKRYWPGFVYQIVSDYPGHADRPTEIDATSEGIRNTSVASSDVIDGLTGGLLFPTVVWPHGGAERRMLSGSVEDMTATFHMGRETRIGPKFHCRPIPGRRR